MGLEAAVDDHTLSIAPMMEVTDRHYRQMMRLLTSRTKLYSDMHVDNTLLHQREHLDYFLGNDALEHPVAVQLGGNDPALLAEATSLCQEFGGYTEINLNVGCPSPKVSEKCFGARLMLDPERVREICHQMIRRATSTPVTVKCRIGADNKDSYEDLTKFVQAVSSSGVRHFIVHARKCILRGLSASRNRSVPPLKYEVVHQLARDFPEMTFVINGGINDFEAAQDHIYGRGDWEGHQCVHGAMMGRAAWHHPWMFRHADSVMFGAARDPGHSRRDIMDHYFDYLDRMPVRWGRTGDKLRGYSAEVLLRPLGNLFSNEPGSKAFKVRLHESAVRYSGELPLQELVQDALTLLTDDVIDMPVGEPLGVD